MTRLLAIESSAEACSVALYRDGEMHVFFEHAPMRHAELLLPAVQSLLTKTGLALENLDAIAFGRGPGSFTSLRIGIGVVQGLAWGAGLPVVPVSSLAAVAQDAVDTAGSGFSSICVAVDARMQEVYTANFRCSSNGIVALAGEERVCEPGLVRALADGPFIAAGNGFERFRELDQLASNAGECHPGIRPRAETICKLALDWLTRNEPLPAGMAQPVYVRNKVASKPGPG
ncbi:MAG: tRNA (adenosine(37)-N6)-threonylcarbamoyltransferase complex dimerization subunit type 1 TsaB [Xanthomonadales bacterium]|nr:tRNA (adenosine(37)-N6)-threonylcarbamoyltransferase complex dimerization subunit type 1 TsaB [Xanthomonadales bacterium]